MAKRLYVAYGSNLNVEQMRWRCPTASVIGTSEIEGYELLFKGSQTGSYLTIEERTGCKVPVAIWEVQPCDEANLDIYEGFPNFYYKKDMVLPIRGVQTGKVRKRKCFVYIMHEDRKLGLPTDRYVDTCLEGYKAFNFKAGYLLEAIRRSGGELK